VSEDLSVDEAQPIALDDGLVTALGLLKGLTTLNLDAAEGARPVSHPAPLPAIGEVREWKTWGSAPPSAGGLLTPPARPP
jgi:hypothetical protein